MPNFEWCSPTGNRAVTALVAERQYFPCGHAHHRTLYGRPGILPSRRVGICGKRWEDMMETEGFFPAWTNIWDLHGFTWIYRFLWAAWPFSGGRMMIIDHDQP